MLDTPTVIFSTSRSLKLFVNVKISVADQKKSNTYPFVNILNEVISKTQSIYLFEIDLYLQIKNITK